MKTKRIIEITNIVWEATNNEKQHLPTTLEVELIVDDSEIIDLYEVLSNWLYNKYGYMHYGFNFNVKSSKTQSSVEINVMWSN